MFPNFLYYVPGFARKLEESFKPLNNLFEDAINTHKANYKTQNQTTDLIDVYMNEIEKTTDPNSTFYKNLGGL